MLFTEHFKSQPSGNITFTLVLNSYIGIIFNWDCCIRITFNRGCDRDKFQTLIEWPDMTWYCNGKFES